MTFRSTVLILPGLGNSGEGHWQTIWEQRFGFKRIAQQEWDKPDCNAWVNNIHKTILQEDNSHTILVGHSLACVTIAAWATKYKHTIKGALLVAPSDVEASTYPAGTTGFSPMILQKLIFPSIVVYSEDDYYVSPERAIYFAECWGSTAVSIGNAGHINVASGYGNWEEGLVYLRSLDA